MIEQIYYAAARHKGESSCTVHMPLITGEISEADKIGTATYTSVPNVPCIKSARTGRKENSDTGKKAVRQFWLLLKTIDFPNVDITDGTIIEYATKRYNVDEFDSNVDKTFWRVLLKYA
jgi:hypothetical protein